MSEDLINSKKEEAVKVGSKADASKQSDGLDYMKEEEYQPESPYFQYVIGEFTKLWIPKKQELSGAFQPKVEVLKDEKEVPIKTDYGTIVRRATWSVINIKGKTKLFSLSVGGKKSTYAKINSRIQEAFKEGKSVLGLKIKKDGSGLATTYDIETSVEPCPLPGEVNLSKEVKE